MFRLYKSAGFKPLATGRFKTRRELVRNVVRFNASGKLSQEQIAEKCEVCQSLVSKILRAVKVTREVEK